MKDVVVGLRSDLDDPLREVKLLTRAMFSSANGDLGDVDISSCAACEGLVLIGIGIGAECSGALCGADEADAGAAKPDTSTELKTGNPGGLTLCVRRCRPVRATLPGATGIGDTIPGTDNEDL